MCVAPKIDLNDTSIEWIPINIQKCAFEQIIGSSVHYNVKQVWIT